MDIKLLTKDAIPDSHPRSKSLNTRHALIEGVKQNVVADSGLIAHGRGEAFDYLLGEKTHDFALDAIRAAAASLFLANNPVISVNGNTAILCPEDMTQFSNKYGIPLEINLFYRSQKRIEAISSIFHQLGAQYLLGTDETQQIELDGFDSYRRIVDRSGIYSADVVVVPLEDGDRTENLVRLGKTVITIDLNPLSRTSIAANVTVVDNIQRIFPILDNYMAEMTKEKAEEILSTYDNVQVLKRSLETMSSFWQKELENKIRKLKQNIH